MFKNLKETNSKQAKRQEVAESWLRCEGATGVELQTMITDEYLSMWMLSGGDILVIVDEAYFNTNSKVGVVSKEQMMSVTDEEGNRYRLSCALKDGVKHW